jgi:hypothetical protein
MEVREVVEEQETKQTVLLNPRAVEAVEVVEMEESLYWSITN